MPQIIPNDYDLSEAGRGREMYALLTALGLNNADAYKLAGYGTDASQRDSLRTSGQRLRTIEAVATRIQVYKRAFEDAAVINIANGSAKPEEMTASEGLVIASRIARDPNAKPSDRLAALKMCSEFGDLKGKAKPPEPESAASAGPRPGDKDWSASLNRGAQVALARLGQQAGISAAELAEPGDGGEIPQLGARRPASPVALA